MQADSNHCLPKPLPLDVIYERERFAKSGTPILPVKPLLGLTLEQQEKQEQDPEVTLEELLGISPCKGYVQTLLQTLDGLYVNQPSQFLPLATEAKKLGKRLKEEEQASQWAGILPKKLLDESFQEQLNYIQTLKQLAPLHCTCEYLPRDNINILECLGKVESTPFYKLYWLAEECADRYYTKAIQTLIEIIKWNQADCQVVLVNSAHALKFLETYVNTEADYVKLNTPDFDPDIDDIPQLNSQRVEVLVTDILTSPDLVNINAANQAENSKGRDQQNPSPILPQDPHQSLHSPSIFHHTQESHLPKQRNDSQPSQENTQTEITVEIPKLEDNWKKKDQFDDADAELLDHHKTPEESNCI